MMQMLAAGGLPILSDSLRPPDEDNPRGYFELEAVKNTSKDPSWLRDAPGKAVKVIHLLLRDLPAGHSYQVIFMRRPIDEVLRSQKAMIRRLGTPASSLPDARLAEIFTRQVENVRQWLDAAPRFRVLDVEFHECFREPLATADRINAFLGGTLNSQAMASAVEPVLHRQR
ncbi:MAG: sulfotransferase [Bryobacterales bacterium]|nr:sulfotransferase [Bryobacterales bacterium]